MAGIFVIGGCKSGKSSIAQEITENLSEKRVYIATGKPTDDEMKKRIKKHQNERGEGWSTIEVNTDLAQALEKIENKKCSVMIDCITAWITNLLMAEKTDTEILKMAEEFGKTVKKSEIPLIIVSNEVGYGIVPVNDLARRFRDLAGAVNQKIAEFSEDVVLSVAGIPVKIKTGKKNISGIS